MTPKKDVRAFHENDMPLPENALLGWNEESNMKEGYLLKSRKNEKQFLT